MTVTAKADKDLCPLPILSPYHLQREDGVVQVLRFSI